MTEANRAHLSSYLFFGIRQLFALLPSTFWGAPFICLCHVLRFFLFFWLLVVRNLNNAAALSIPVGRPIPWYPCDSALTLWWRIWAAEHMPYMPLRGAEWRIDKWRYGRIALTLHVVSQVSYQVPYNCSVSSRLFACRIMFLHTDWEDVSNVDVAIKAAEPSGFLVWQ